MHPGVVVVRLQRKLPHPARDHSSLLRHPVSYFVWSGLRFYHQKTLLQAGANDADAILSQMSSS